MPEADIEELLIVGFGYTARAIAARLAPRVGRLVATTRTADRFAPILAAGGQAILFDGTAPSPELAAALATATHLLVSAPAEEGGDPLLKHHAGDVRAARRLTAIVYLSTVGVYGDHANAWVDETTPVRPSHARGARRVAAETAWQEAGAAAGAPTAVLRLAGIYGPGRNAFVNLDKGTAHRIVKPGQVFNRIHVDDIAATVEAAIDRGGHGLFNVADDEPAAPQDVVAFAASLMGVPPPPEVDFETAELTPMARSFYADRKRVRNDRIKAELGVRLVAPTYREGLGALWRDATWRGDAGPA